jgi:hypothetical protein
MEKYITLEKNLIRLKNCISAINSLINYDSFCLHGRYAYAYSKNYNGGERARHQVRKTLKSTIRLVKVVNKQHDFDDDISITRRILNYQTDVLKIQQMFL